jgi:hypothetical protein
MSKVLYSTLLHLPPLSFKTVLVKVSLIRDFRKQVFFHVSVSRMPLGDGGTCCVVRNKVGGSGRAGTKIIQLG